MAGKFDYFPYLDVTRFLPSTEVQWEYYDLIILVDTEDLLRATSLETDNYNQLGILKSKTVVIDHHDCKMDSRHALNICNTQFTSCTHLIIRLMEQTFGKLELSEESSKLAQLGIIADSNRFLYSQTNDVFKLMSDLTEISMLDLEETTVNINKLPQISIGILETLLHNTFIEDRALYTFLDTSVYENEAITEKDIKDACGIFLQKITRYLDKVDLVSLIKPTRKYGMWRIQFRSRKDTINTSELAKKFEGGGHINASSAVIYGDDVNEVADAIRDGLRVL
jgi:phosphoesterase RecJ-like protein